jgi:hypothetical protein
MGRQLASRDGGGAHSKSHGESDLYRGEFDLRVANYLDARAAISGSRDRDIGPRSNLGRAMLFNCCLWVEKMGCGRLPRCCLNGFLK